MCKALRSEVGAEPLSKSERPKELETWADDGNDRVFIKNSDSKAVKRITGCHTSWKRLKKIVDLVILQNVGLSLKFKSWLLEMASWRVKCERLKSIEFANDAPWCVDSIFAPPCIAAVSRSLFLFCYELHAANSFWEFYLCPHLSLTPWISPCHVVIESKCITRGRGRYELWEAS